MKKKQSTPFVPLVFLVILLVWLWDACEETVEYLFIRTPPSLMKFQTLWARDPQRIIVLCVFGLLCIITVFRFFHAVGKTAGGNSASARQPKTYGRPAPVREPRTPGRTSRSKFPEKLEVDEAIHCAHLNGRQKYLEQIDNYLKTGLIDRSEYRVLKERYMNLDIPDDYH